MKFPSAANGVKKIFTAEILKLISTFLLIGTAITGIFGLAAQKSESTDISGVFFLITGVLAIALGVITTVGFILNLVGIIQSSKDEPAFKSALVCIILGIVCSFTASAFSSNAVVSGVANSLLQFFNLVVTIFVIQGVIRLADRLNRGDVSSKGTLLFKQMLVIYLLIIIANVISTIFGGAAVSVVAGILVIVAGVLSIIQYVLYLNFLSNAKKMLKES